MSFPSSYLLVEDARKFAKARALATDAISDDVQFQALLLRASELIDHHYRFIGRKRDQGQIRQWPRSDAVDDNHHPIMDVPDAVLSATLTIALLLASDEAEAMRALGLAGQVRSERIGDIEVRYQHDKSAGARLIQSLRPYLRSFKPIEVRRT